MKKYLAVLVFIISAVYLVYVFDFMGPDLSSPAATIAVSRQYVGAGEWSELHVLFEQKLAEKIDQKVKQLLRFIASRLPEGEKKSLVRLATMGAEGRFVSLMESLVEEPETKELIEAYEKAEINLEKQSSTGALIELKSEKKLPFRQIKLQKQNGKWLIKDFPDLNW
jgi:signal recognition particle subunit SEC65